MQGCHADGQHAQQTRPQRALSMSPTLESPMTVRSYLPAASLGPTLVSPCSVMV